MSFSIDGKRSFTVVELLLAGVIFALVSLGLFQVLVTGTRIFEKARASQRIYRQALTVMAFLTQDLHNAIHYDFSQSYPEELAFKGEADRVQLIKPSAAGLQVVTYAVKEDGKKKVPSLYRVTQPLVNFVSRSDEKISEEVMVRGLKDGDGVQFSYGKLESQDAGVAKFIWKSQWTDPRLPAVVKVTTEIANPDDPEHPVEFSRTIYFVKEIGQQ